MLGDSHIFIFSRSAYTFFIKTERIQISHPNKKTSVRFCHVYNMGDTTFILSWRNGLFISSPDIWSSSFGWRHHHLPGSSRGVKVKPRSLMLILLGLCFYRLAFGLLLLAVTLCGGLDLHVCDKPKSEIQVPFRINWIWTYSKRNSIWAYFVTILFRNLYIWIHVCSSFSYPFCIL